MKGHPLKFLVIATICLLIAAGCAAPPPPPTPTPVPPTPTPVPPTPVPVPPTATSVSALGPQHIEIAKAYFAAVKGQDIEAILALFADTFNHYVNDYLNVTTKDQLRGWYEFGVGLGSTFEPGDCRIENDAVICPAVYRDNCMDAGPVVYQLDMKFLFKEGKIALLFAPIKSGKEKASRQVIVPIRTWAEQNRAEEWSKLTGALSRQEGEIYTSVCKAYIDSQKAAASATPTPAPSSDLLNLAKSYQDAYNAGDLDAALALFVDEGLSFMAPSGIFRNKEPLRAFLEIGVGWGQKIEFVDCAPYDNGLRCTSVEHHNCLRAMCGLDVYHGEMTLKPKDGKIQLMSFRSGDVGAQDEKACAEAGPKFWAWASANRPEEWKKIHSPTAYDLKGRALGELLSQVCQAYLEATGK